VRLGLALVCAFALFQFRIQPAAEVVAAQGGFGRMQLWFHADHYSPETINAYTFGRLFWESNGIRGSWLGSLTSICVGPVIVLLGLIGAMLAFRRVLPLLVVAALCAWLMLAHHAPIDAFRPLWELPVLSAIDAPGKYFSFYIVMVGCVCAGMGLDAVSPKISQRARLPVLSLLIAAAVAFPFIESFRIHNRSYSYRVPSDWDRPPREYLAIKSDNLPRGRFLPANANTYLNLRRGVGTLDWYSGIPLHEIAVTKVIVEADGSERINPDYRGEAWWSKSSAPSPQVHFDYHSIRHTGLQGGSGDLVVNQNHHEDWRADRGVAINSSEGQLLRLAIPLGTTDVSLTYRSRALRRGGLFSLFFALFLLGLSGLRSWARRSPSTKNRGFRASLGRALDWLTR
jgi:hypothetical protein